MLNICELTSNGTQLSIVRVTRCQSLLRLSLEPLCLFWSLLVLKDWLFSSVDPYPYLAAGGISGAVTAGFVVLLLIRHPGRWLGVVLAVGLLWQTAFEGGWQFLGVALGVAGLSFGLGWFPTQSSTSSLLRWKFAKYAGLAALFAAGLFLIWRGLGLSAILSVIVAHSSSAFWLGQGIGTMGENGAIPFSLRLMQEQGLPLIVTLVVTMVFAFACGISVLALSQDFPDRLLRIVLCAIALGSLYGLLLMAPGGLSFETTHSIPGTWLFALAVACLGIAAAPEYQTKQRSFDTPIVKSRWKRMVSQFLFGLFVVLMVAVASIEHSLHRQVASRTQVQVTVPLAAVSVPMQDATVAMEDGHFYSHHGFDWIAMHRALRVDLREGRIEQGGSTLTQQLAKNLFLSNDRTLWRKVQEAFYTAELEHNLSKPRILELYLNTIDYGCGQHGIKAAAAYYFHKAPAQLTLPESAILVGLVPRPPQTPTGLNDDLLARGQQTALERIAFFFPQRYSQAKTEAAGRIPLDYLIYPDKDALDRGAIDTLPATWHGVGFYFFADPDEPSMIDHVSPFLKPALAAFLDEARRKYSLTGVDHLGVYNDRPMRQSQTTISAHAFGQAIDVSGFRFKNGSHVSVENHTAPKIAARLAPLEALLKKHFPIVVDWRDDPLRHQTHFHCEVRGQRQSIAPSRESIALFRNVTHLTSETALSNQGLNTDAPKIGQPPSQRFKLWQQGCLVRQTTPSSCGPACLATVLTYYLGRPTTDAEMIDLSGTRGSGSGPDDLEKACNAVGYQAIFYKMTLAQMLHHIAATNVPVVASWPGHWVVVVGQDSTGSILVSNPNAGNQSMSKAQFLKLWNSGEALSLMLSD